MSHISHIRRTDPLCQITLDVILSDQFHIAAHILNQFFIIPYVLEDLSKLFLLHLGSRGDRRTLCTITDDLHKLHHIFIIQSTDIEHRFRLVRNRIMCCTALGNDSVYPAVILEMQAHHIYRVKHQLYAA